MSEYLPNSYLLGVHLTISTHSGPLMVYSYPPARVDALDKMRYSSQTGELSKSGRHKSIRNRDQGIASSSRPDFRFDVESSVISKKSLKSNISSSSSSSSISSSNSEHSNWSSSEGLSDSELSTDYSDQSYSSDNNSIVEATDQTIRGNPVATDIGVITDDGTYSPSKDAKLLKLLNTTTNLTTSNKTDELNIDAISFELADETNSKFNEDFFTEDNFQNIDKVFGFNSEFVAEFCCPDRELCNTRFELTIDQFCFLGLPIHCDSNGKWRKSKRKKRGSKRHGSSLTASRSNRSTSLSASVKSNTVSQPETNDQLDIENSQCVENADLPEADNIHKSMNMFHVCFVLNPPLIEYNKRIDDMYQYVVAKLSLLLRYLQSKSNYVSEQCEIILKERENVTKSSLFQESSKTPNELAKFLYERIIAKSSLARELTKCVDQIHKNKIACIELGERIVSLQIPIKNEFQHIPDYKIDPILPNAFLSTISNNTFLERSMNALADSNAIDRQTGHSTLNRLNQYNAFHFGVDDEILNYALLLLDEPSNILKRLEESSQNKRDNDINSIILKQVVKNVQPTVSLISYHHIITDTLQLEPSSITSDILRSCALHLIYWRYARVILPISSKHTYIVSPLASFDETFSNDEVKFKEKFSSLPSLGYFLSNLSGSESRTVQEKRKLKPLRPFNSLIPSKEHKSVYLNVLSWLLRRGYVCQLLTFVVVRVDERIKLEVDEELENEGYKKKRLLTCLNNSGDNDMDASMIMKKNAIRSDNIDSSSKTHISEQLLEDEPFVYDDPDMQQDYTIILEPERATALEKRWLYRCIHDQPPDIQSLFKRLLKYFNGSVPIEVIMLNEGITRHAIRKLFTALGKYLVEIHHW